MKKLLFFAVCTFILTLNSCVEEDVNADIVSNVPVDFQNFIDNHDCFNQEVFGKLYLTSRSSAAYQSEVGKGFSQVEVDVKFGGSQTEAVNFGEIFIDETNIPFNSQYNFYAGAFNKLKFGIDNKILIGNPQETGYEFNFKTPNLVKLIDESNSATVTTLALSENMHSLQWVADNTNNFGLVIKLAYDPNLSANFSLAEEGFNKPINNVIYTEDNGNYTFKASDFANIPQGAEIDLDVIRMNCNVEENLLGEKLLVVAVAELDIPLVIVEKWVD